MPLALPRTHGVSRHSSSRSQSSIDAPTASLSQLQKANYEIGISARRKRKLFSPSCVRHRRQQTQSGELTAIQTRAPTNSGPPDNRKNNKNRAALRVAAAAAAAEETKTTGIMRAGSGRVWLGGATRHGVMSGQGLECSRRQEWLRICHRRLIPCPGALIKHHRPLVITLGPPPSPPVLEYSRPSVRIWAIHGTITDGPINLSFRDSGRGSELIGRSAPNHDRVSEALRRDKAIFYRSARAAHTVGRPIVILQLAPRSRRKIDRALPVPIDH